MDFLPEGAQEKIEAFKAAVARAADILSWWRSNRNEVLKVAPDLFPKGERAAGEIERLSRVYQWITQKVDEISRSVATHMQGLGDLKNLGALPLVAWAIIAGSIGIAIVSFNNMAQELYEIRRIYNERKERIERGETLPVPAGQPDWLQQLGSNVVIPLAIVAGLWLFMQTPRR